MRGQITCKKCKAVISAHDVFCPYCGIPTGMTQAWASNVAAPPIPGQDLPNVMVWNFNISFFNRLIVGTMLKVTGIAILVLVTFLIILGLFYGGFEIMWSGDIIYLLMIGGIIVIGTIITLLVAYRNRYEVRFRVDTSGASYKTIGKTRKQNAVVSFLLLIGGLYTKSPGLVGMSMLSASTQEDGMNWNEVRELKFYPKQHAIMLKGRIRRFIVYCKPENYETVSRMCLYYHTRAGR